MAPASISAPCISESGSLQIRKVCGRKALQRHAERGSLCHSTTQALTDRHSQISVQQLRTTREFFGNFLSPS
jgi:hypothetical protein